MPFLSSPFHIMPITPTGCPPTLIMISFLWFFSSNCALLPHFLFLPIYPALYSISSLRCVLTPLLLPLQPLCVHLSLMTWLSCPLLFQFQLLVSRHIPLSALIKPVLLLEHPHLPLINCAATSNYSLYSVPHLWLVLCFHSSPYYYRYY
jgi:hypothetical protein